MRNYIFFLSIFVRLIHGQIEKSSLTFVIDDTGSMSDEISQVKHAVNLIFDTVTNSNTTQIEDFVLVTFNDPTFEFRTSTTSRDEFKEQLSSIKVNGGGDCEEMSLSGIDLALTRSKPGSFIYVFTDASAKDANKVAEVQSKAIKYNSQIVFVLTGYCTDNKDPQYLVYHKLAEATLGQVFHLEKQDVKEILNYIVEQVNITKTTITSKKFPPGSGHKLTFPVDPDMKTVFVSESGKNPTIDVKSPDGSKSDTEQVVDLSDIKAVRIDNPISGNYTAIVGSDSNSSVVVTASTSIKFKHGFSGVQVFNIGDTATRPVAGEKTYLSVKLVTPDDDKVLESVDVIDIEEKLILQLSLNVINKKEKLYSTDKFLPPNDIFKIVLKGLDRKTKIPFRRIAPTPIEVQRPALESTETKAPIVTFADSNKINAVYSKPLKIACKVAGYPKPDIIWRDETNATFSPPVATIELPYDYISILEIEKVTKNSTYTCIALNVIGENSKPVYIETTARKEKPEIGNFSEIIHVNRGHNTEISCRIIKGSPKPEVAWLFKKEGTENFVKLNKTAEVLQLSHLDFQHDGVYRCLAYNEAGQDFRETSLVVDYAPVIEKAERYIKSLHGESTTLKCVVHGEPKPKVSWLRDGVQVFNDRTHHIYRDHSLRFKGSLENSGKFKCVATNRHGTATRTVHVAYVVPVSIEPPKRSSLEVNFNSDISLPCRADGYPRPNIKWIFFSTAFNKLMVMRSTVNSSLLNLRNLQLYQDGYYTCVARNIYSAANITYQLQVIVKPYIEQKFLKNTYYAVVHDLVLMIPCRAKGNPKPEITWSRNDLNIATGTEWYDITDDGTLIIKNIDEKSGGTYVCQARNKAGEDIKVSRVIVKPFPDSITPTRTVILQQNNTTDLTCDIPHTRLDYVRWYKNDKLIVEGILTLRNIQTSDAGIYTCRVSTFFQSSSTAVAVVVGFPPAFVDDTILNINYENNIPAFLDCTTYAEPKPEIIWTHNGKQLNSTEMLLVFDMNSDTRGQYNCLVKNYFGSINRTFEIISRDCFLYAQESFTQNQPLMIEPSLLTLPQFETANGFVRISANKTLLLHCPSGFSNFPRSNAIATCEGDTNFKVYGKIFKYSEITCQEEVTPRFKRMGSQCMPGNTETVKIGFEFNEEFLEVFEICLDKDKNIPIYAKAKVYKSNIDVNSNIDVEWNNNDLLNLTFSEIYDCDRQINEISSILRKWFHPTDKCCFNNRKLINPIDLPPGLLQKAAFSYLNIVPQWSSCGSENWELLENKIRDLAKSSYDDLVVWTGTSGHLQLINDEANLENISLRDSAGREQAVPLYLWKVVQNPATDSSLAIIQLNMPDVTLFEASRYILCRDICRDIPWMADHLNWRNPTKGFTFCCSLQDFEHAFRMEGLFGDNRKILRVPSSSGFRIY